MKHIFAYIFLSLICIGLAASDANKVLIQKRVKELKELNEAVLKNSKILENYNDQSVYVKARIVEKENNSYELILKEVSSSPIDDSDNWHTPTIPEKTNDFIYLQGKVHKTPDTKFTIDFDNILPPEPKNNIKNKTQE